MKKIKINLENREVLVEIFDLVAVWFGTCFVFAFRNQTIMNKYSSA